MAEVNSIRQKFGAFGNPNIRREGVKIEWTHQQLEEYVKCKTDPIYFVENYVKIKVNGESKLQPFKIRFYQREMIEKFLTDDRVIVKLPRQCGKTVCVTAILLWHAIFHENFNILVAANNQKKAQDVLSLFKKMFELLPPWLQHGIKDGGWNKKEVLLENGSFIRAVATSESAGRGDTYDLVYLDEFAFVPSHMAKGFMESVFPTISSGKGAKLFITSTPKGLNTFYRMWKDATTTDPEKWNGYAHVEIKWNDVPGRDEAFKQKVIKESGQVHFDQEYAAEFLGSSSTLISGHKLATLSADSPLHINKEMTTWTYKEPEKGHHYAITVDVSEGLGQDYSAMIVFDVTMEPHRTVAMYRCNEIDPMAFPGVIYNMARTYNNALVLVETNFGGNLGIALQDDYDYENLVMTTTVAQRGQQAAGNYAARSRVGMQMTPLTKRIGCSNLKSVVESDRLVINDEVTIDELTRFVQIKKSYAAEPPHHDDLAMCLVMFGWLVDQPYIKDMTNVDVRRSIAAMNAERIENELGPVGISAANFYQEVEEVDDGGYSMSGTSWLLGGPDPDDPEPDSDKMEAYERMLGHFNDDGLDGP
jgi:hypothetical protein